MKVFSVRLPVELIRDVKVHAARTGSSVQRITAEALDAYLRRVPKELR